MAEKTYLIGGQSLDQEDNLVSADGRFKAFLWENGLLSIQDMSKNEFMSQRDTGKSSDKDVYQLLLTQYANLMIFSKDTTNILWDSGPRYQDPIECFVILSNDGYLQIHIGTPDHPVAMVWVSHTFIQRMGTLDKITQIESIKYDIVKAKFGPSQLGELYSQIVDNGSTELQISTINGQEAVTEEYSWSHSLGVSVTLGTSFNCGIPIIAEGKVDVSLELSYQFTWGGSVSKEESWGFEVPMSVPPGKKYLCSILVAMTQIYVPYRADAIAMTKEGVPLYITFFGKCTSKVSHDLLSKFSEFKEKEEIPGRIP
jgi:hypothetical protein